MEEIILESGLKISIEKKNAVVLGHTDPLLRVLTIPFEIVYDNQKISMVGINSNAFSKSALEEVNIPSSMKRIGDFAFSHCENLKQINFVDSEKEYNNRLMHMDMFGWIDGLVIGKHSFSGCNSLTEIHIPMYVREILDGAFFSCSTLEKVVWNELDRNELLCTECGSEYPRHSVSIGSEAFAFCKKLNELKLSPLVRNINSNIIQDTALSTIDLPARMNNIDECAFAFSNIESIVFPSDFIIIRYGTCQYCEKLKNIVLPSELGYIRESAFKNCTSLKEIYIPKSVKEIEPTSFRGCLKLSTVTCSKQFAEKFQKYFPANVVFDVY